MSVLPLFYILGFILQSLAVSGLIVKDGLSSYFRLLGLKQIGFGFYNYYKCY